MYLETDRLIIRPMEDRDFGDWSRYATDPESCRMLGTWVPDTPEKAREAFDWLMVHEKRFYAVVLRSACRGVGYIIVQNFPAVGDRPELRGKTGRCLTFCVDREYRRQGIASEAVAAVVDYLFRQRQVDYVNSGYFDFNVPSRELHKKLGFRPLCHQEVSADGEKYRGVETVIFREDWPE